MGLLDKAISSGRMSKFLGKRSFGGGRPNFDPKTIWFVQTCNNRSDIVSVAYGTLYQYWIVSYFSFSNSLLLKNIKQFLGFAKRSEYCFVLSLSNSIGPYLFLIRCGASAGFEKSCRDFAI
jgi:hypothetical protein